MKRQFLFQTCLAFSLLAAPWPALAGSTWNIETVDSTGWVGEYTSLALDGGGNAHISYFDIQNCDLKYAAFNGSSWDIQTVDSAGNVGDYTSLALDTSGNPHISYRHGSNGNLMYAAFNGSTWDIETVDTGNVGHYTSIALDTDGHPHISYHDLHFNPSLKYASFNGSTWDIETVDSTGDVGHNTSIALDTDGNPHISYSEQHWHPEYIHIRYDLKYAGFNGSTWNIETLDSTGDILYPVYYSTSIALDTDGYPHISYFDFDYYDTFFDLNHAAFNGSTWNIETIETIESTAPGPFSIWTSLAIDAGHNPHISYYDGTKQDLKYAAFNGSTWDIETVDSTGNVGWWTSIALDADGYPHISYYDRTNLDLKYAYVYHCEYVLAGDLNDNCTVDFLDVQTFVNTCWLSAGPECDLYVDGWVDFRDFAVIAKNWLIDCDQTPGDPACVPKAP